MKGIVIVERTFQAPVEKVWRAMTEHESIAKWFFPLPKFKPEVGFAFTFYATKDGVTYRHLCRIVEVVADERMVWNWRYEGYEGDSTVTFGLLSEADKTRFKLTHAGLDTFPQTGGFEQSGFEQGWDFIISALQKVIEKT